jgi:hypothetical protein
MSCECISCGEWIENYVGHRCPKRSVTIDLESKKLEDLHSEMELLRAAVMIARRSAALLRGRNIDGVSVHNSPERKWNYKIEVAASELLLVSDAMEKQNER